jgi:hypothetical protein
MGFSRLWRLVAQQFFWLGLTVVLFGQVGGAARAQNGLFADPVERPTSRPFATLMTVTGFPNTGFPSEEPGASGKTGDAGKKKDGKTGKDGKDGKDEKQSKTGRAGRLSIGKEVKDDKDDGSAKEDQGPWRLFPGIGTYRLPFTNREKADIRNPGPDTPDFPDSSLTVPPGVVYVEYGNQFLRFHPAGLLSTNFYQGALLVRVGMWSELEMRIYGAPFVDQFDPQFPPGTLLALFAGVRNRQFGRASFGVANVATSNNTLPTSGLSPMGLGVKKTFWKEQDDSWLPGFGVELGSSIPMGNPAFNPGVGFFYAAFNFDKQIGELFDFNFTYSPSQNLNTDNQMFLQHIFQWSFSKEFDFLKNVEFFTHGFAAWPGSSGHGHDLMVGIGGVWYATKRLAFDASYDLGLTSTVPRQAMRIGISTAF